MYYAPFQNIPKWGMAASVVVETTVEFRNIFDNRYNANRLTLNPADNLREFVFPAYG